MRQLQRLESPANLYNTGSILRDQSDAEASTIDGRYVLAIFIATLSVAWIL